MGKRDPRDERRGRVRLQWLTFIVILSFCVLVGRLFYLQFFQYEHYSQFAEENQLQRQRIVAPRGLIKDRNGTVLVDNVPQFDIVMSSRDAEKVQQTVLELAAYLPLDTLAIFKRLDRWGRRNAGLPFPIVSDADKLMISFVRENYDLFPMLRVATNSKRRYRNGPFAAHLIGYVGEVSDRFLSGPAGRGYLAGDLIGKTGVEGVAEKSLRGTDGLRVVAVNASGTVLGEVPEMTRPPVPGRDVELTIDAHLQAHLESLIQSYHAGAAVVMDVREGEILAAVSLPHFDPNKFAVGISPEEWKSLHEAPGKPLFNRFLQATYPPGSTMKVISVYSVLYNQIANPSEALVYCDGTYRFGNRTFRCWKEWGHGWADLRLGLIESCDSYFYRIGEMIDVDELAESCREFGLGARTGIDLPNEIEGLVPDRAYYNRRYGVRKWTQGLVLNNIIGQGEFLTSVLQMCRVAAAVANGGYLVTPHVVANIEGKPAPGYPKRKVRNLNGSTLRFIREVMEAVVESAHGTGKASRVPGIRSAGKTGTAQNPHGKDHAWFISYAPADEPEIAVAVVIENAGHGGSVAAPVVGQFYREYFKDRLPEVASRKPPTAVPEAETVPAAVDGAGGVPTERSPSREGGQTNDRGGYEREDDDPAGGQQNDDGGEGQ